MGRGKPVVQQSVGTHTDVVGEPGHRLLQRLHILAHGGPRTLLRLKGLSFHNVVVWLKPLSRSVSTSSLDSDMSSS